MGKRGQHAAGRMVKERVAFFQSVFGTMGLYLNDYQELQEDAESTPNVTVIFGADNKAFPFTRAISTFTTEELDLFEEFITLAIRMARPVVTERDQIAEAAFEAGDDSYARYYRQKPRLVVRPPLDKSDEFPVYNQLVDILSESKHVLLDPKAFKQKRANMDFWSDPEPEEERPAESSS